MRRALPQLDHNQIAVIRTEKPCADVRRDLSRQGQALPWIKLEKLGISWQAQITHRYGWPTPDGRAL
jgi:hypothetical protein